MDELTEWDVEQLKRMCERNDRSGYLVQTKSGLFGRTLHTDPHVNGKLLVYTEDGNKLLCDPTTVLFKGFID